MKSPLNGRRGVALVSAATMIAAVTAAAALPTGAAAPAAPVSPVAEPALPGGLVERIAGADRYQTAAEIAGEYPQDAPVVYVASGEQFADSLSARAVGGPASGATNAPPTPDVDGAGVSAPVLLTKPDVLPDVTAAALEGFAGAEIVVVGGTAAVSAEVQTELEAYGEVTRIGGETRYDTSAAIAARFPVGLPVVYVATGEDFPDALAGGAVASRSGSPILLTEGDQLTDATADALRTLAPDSVVVFGGSGAVDDTVVNAVADIVPDTTRVAGTDRYGTAAVISAAYPQDLEQAYVATGTTYPDALAGSALAGYLGSPLLLTRPGEVPESTYGALDDLSPQGITVLGGTGAVGDEVPTALDPELEVWVDQAHLQMLSFNDYHGHLEAEDGATLDPEQDPEQTEVGGAEFLSSNLDMLRSRSLPDQTMTVAAGDLIGGSPFLSGIFHDEPSVESLNLMELDVSGVGNHEFDEGVDELLRMQEGGCHPVDGCYFPDEPYAGADFPWLAANVVDKESGESILPGTYVQEVAGVPVGFVGMTLESTPSLVSPGGVATVDFLDEVETANEQAAALQAQGVESIVVLLHEGGYQEGTFNDCVGISGPVVEIAEQLDASIDQVVTGHTHQPYVCSIADPSGEPRLVTSANQFGRVVTESDVVLSRSTGDVVRAEGGAENHLVTREIADPEMTALIAKWSALSEEQAAQVVGTVAEDITGDASGNRGIETDMGNVIADAILYGTDEADEGGAQIAFMNVGGIRASLLVDQITNEEEPGEITYAEAFAVAPFGNILVSVDLTGADVKDVLEQQFDAERGRQYLALGVSEGFTYTFDKDAPAGSKVSGMELDGEPIDPATTYRVSTLNFLQEGGDDFTALTRGTNLVGGPEDLQNLVDYLGDNPGLTAPEDRVDGL